MHFSRLVWLAVALPLAGFLVNGALSLWRPRAKGLVSLVGPGVLLGAFAVSLGVFLELWRQPPHEPLIVRLWSWLPVDRLQVDLAFQVDQLSAVMLLIVTGVGSLIHLFSVGYMREDPGYARYFAYLNLFVVFMLVLVLGSSFPVMFIGWEGVGLCSYLLIGFWFSEKANADAGKKAFIMNRIGDFGFMVAMFLIWRTFGSLDFAQVSGSAGNMLEPGGAIVTAITLFLFLGCTGKSAQIPLYTWLPDAMAGPTPVSALIHAATMVTAGVYLVARTNVLFALAPLSSTVVAGIGALTALFAATIGLRQYDIKKVLAYSTVSQLGYMFLGVGTGAYVSGVFHLATHAFFKALLFLGAGSVIHAMHHAYHATHSHEDAQDMRNMGGLRRQMPVTFALMMIATLAIAGIPPFSGFFSKDEILAAAFARGGTLPVFYVFYGMGVLAALLTAFYMARLMAMTFLGENRTGERERDHLHEAPWIMTGPLVVLGVLSAIGGVINLPHLVGGHAALERWLEPVMEPGLRFTGLVMPSGSTEFFLVGAAVAIGALGLYLGFRATLGRPTLPANRAPADTGLGLVIYRKYYVDELYDAVIVRPVAWLSRVVLWRGIDQRLVDGVAVNGTAWVSRVAGSGLRLLQTGQVGIYVVLFLVGALWILSAVIR
ncbi:MAG: NADH-quinone oxidoreductase subunit L [Gemmatimonadales bacterium]